jgi:uncharacterized repeat protein (TIGR01451 family)
MPSAFAGRLLVLVAGVGAVVTGCGSDDSKPVLRLQKTGATYTAPLAPFLYTVIATNNGGDVSGARVVDQLPPETDMGVLEVNSTAPWSCTSDLMTLQVVCTVDTFAAGAMTEFEIFGFFTDALQPGDRVKNTATLSAQGAASATASWSSEVLPPTQVSVTKRAPATAVADESIRYDLTLTNDGQVPALMPRILEFLPDDVFPTSYTAPPGWECEFAPFGPARYFCVGPDVAHGASAAISISMHVSAEAAAGTILTNRIVGQALNSDEAEASAATEVVLAADPD